MDCNGTLFGRECPIVNTVTPRARYWSFMIWIYYDFYKYSGIPDHTVPAFDAYLKRQDYFFVLATLLTEGSDQSNLVGKQQSQIDIDDNPMGLIHLIHPISKRDMVACSITMPDACLCIL